MNHQSIQQHGIVSTGMIALLALTLAFPGHANADEEVIAGLAMPVSLVGVVDVLDCNNANGPQVTLSGDMFLGGVTMRIILQNNAKGTHKTSVNVNADMVLINEGASITIPKQPVLGGVGGNPHIWLQLHDGEGNDQTEEIYLGRCVQGLVVTSDLINQILIGANIQTSNCRNSPGPVITLSGGITFSGLHARFIFRNNLKGTHTAEETADLTLIEDGSTIEIPKQPVQGGVGGNPIISIQFLHGDGTPVGEPVVLGRCVKI